MKWFYEAILKYLLSRGNYGSEPVAPVDNDETCPDCGELHEPGDYFDQPSDEEEEKNVISGVMETWTNLFEVINHRKPNFDEINAQYLVSNFALEQTNSMMPGLYMMAEGVAAEEGYASPPPWAVKIARGTVLEYIAGNMGMVSQVVRKAWENE